MGITQICSINPPYPDTSQASMPSVRLWQAVGACCISLFYCMSASEHRLAPAPLQHGATVKTRVSAVHGKRNIMGTIDYLVL